MGLAIMSVLGFISILVVNYQVAYQAGAKSNTEKIYWVKYFKTDPNGISTLQFELSIAGPGTTEFFGTKIVVTEIHQ